MFFFITIFIYLFHDNVNYYYKHAKLHNLLTVDKFSDRKHIFPHQTKANKKITIQYNFHVP